MTGIHKLSEDESKWLLVLASSKKSFVAKTMPRAIQNLLLEKGLIAIVQGFPRTTTEGKAELVRVMI